MTISKAEWRLMLIGVPLFMMANYAGNRYYAQPFVAVAGKITATFFLASLVWLTIRFTRNFLLRSFRGHLQLLKRILVTVTVGTIVGAILSLVLSFLSANAYDFTIISWVDLFGPMFFFSILVTGAHEVLYSFFEMQKLIEEREGLKKAHVQSQLDSLKSQVNPHFLFNSLNTLSSLVSISPQQAERFIDELSNVYRYLLQSNEKELATLQSEIEFLNSYYHLLKTRYGDAIELTTSVDPSYMKQLLPSLSLQLLMENATKHNVISVSKPLQIRVYINADANRLIMVNSLQRKVNPVPSNKMGLVNIMKKLELLNQPKVIIQETENEFMVSMPLIKN